MTNRELFREIMFYGTFDRMPVVHWHGWNETMERWYKEGLDPKANIHEVLGTKPHWSWIGAHLDLMPWFPEEVLKETDEYRIKRGGDGVVQQEWKNKSCIPHYVDFTLKTAADWPEYKKRLQPDPARINPKLDEWIEGGIAEEIVEDWLFKPSLMEEPEPEEEEPQKTGRRRRRRGGRGAFHQLDA